MRTLRWNDLLHISAIDCGHNILQFLFVPALKLRFECCKDLTEFLLADVEAGLELLVGGAVGQLRVPLDYALDQIVNLRAALVQLLC